MSYRAASTMLPIPLASFSPDFKASKVRNHMSLTQFAFILESILPHGFFTVKTFWQQTDSISRKTHRSAALQRTGGLLQLLPLGKISVSIAIRIEIQRKAFANMLMFCVRISSTWLSQYQNSIIDCGEIQLKTSYFSFLIFAFSSIIRNRSKSLSYRRSCTKRYFSYSVSA